MTVVQVPLKSLNCNNTNYQQITNKLKTTILPPMAEWFFIAQKSLKALKAGFPTWEGVKHLFLKIRDRNHVKMRIRKE